jgi:hypothetical protein
MDFENMAWECHVCAQERKSKYIKVSCHDISDMRGQETGVIYINCRYCGDIPACKEKAFNREWVYNRFFKKEIL